MPVDVMFSRPLDSQVGGIEKIWAGYLESHIAKTIAPRRGGRKDGRENTRF